MHPDIACCHLQYKIVQPSVEAGMPPDRALGHLFDALVGRAPGRRGRSWVLATLALGIFSAPLSADAQQPAKVARIGFLWGGGLSGNWLDEFRKGMREHGYVEGRNITIEQRSAEGNSDRFPGLAAELVALKPDVIVVAASTPAALAAKNATSTIPIVFAYLGDPVGTGVVASLARPGGNITGLSNTNVDLSAKRLELLKEVAPKVSRVAALWIPTNPVHQRGAKENEVAARQLRLQLQYLDVREPNGLDRAFGAITRERADSLFVFPDILMFVHRSRIVDFAARNRLPAVYQAREFVDAGGLMSYGVNTPAQFRRAATYVDKILKGANPADLPVEQPTRFELVVNLKTAKALGLTIPQSVLIRADHLIQ
jgi:putative ABC transport system substrate-binding protein